VPTCEYLENGHNRKHYDERQTVGKEEKHNTPESSGKAAMLCSAGISEKNPREESQNERNAGNDCGRAAQPRQNSTRNTLHVREMDIPAGTERP